MKPEEVKLFCDGEEYYMNQGNTCKGCEKELDEIGVLRCMWSKVNSKIGTFCLNCFNKIKSYSDIQEVKIFNVVEHIPKGAYPIVIQPPGTQYGKNGETVFSAAFKDAPETVDRTVHALKESWGGARIGLPPEQVENKVVPVDDIDAFLLGVKDSTPLLPPTKKKKELTHGSD